MHLPIASENAATLSGHAFYCIITDWTINEFYRRPVIIHSCNIYASSMRIPITPNWGISATINYIGINTSIFKIRYSAITHIYSTTITIKIKIKTISSSANYSILSDNTIFKLWPIHCGVPITLVSSRIIIPIIFPLKFNRSIYTIIITETATNI